MVMIMDEAEQWSKACCGVWVRLWERVSPLVWRICRICSRRFQHWSALSAGSLETQDPGERQRDREGAGGRVRWWTWRLGATIKKGWPLSAPYRLRYCSTLSLIKSISLPDLNAHLPQILSYPANHFPISHWIFHWDLKSDCFFNAVSPLWQWSEIKQVILANVKMQHEKEG